ncbi:MAG: hypothetical protein J6C40_02240 [Lentisphaeria bacterium]|nr:hypothetical protein [Lentisphaeria bacterium]
MEKYCFGDILQQTLYETLIEFYRGFGVLRTLNAPIKYAALFYRGIAPGERYCLCEAMLTLRLYFRRHFKAATSVPPLDHVRVRPGAGYALRADFFSVYVQYTALQ